MLQAVKCDRCTDTAQRTVFYGTRSENLCKSCALEEYHHRQL